MKSKTILTWLSGLFLMALLVLLPSHTLRAQTRKISIQADNQTVAQVMKLIEQKSGFTFIYKDGVVDTGRLVSVSATDEDVLEILKRVFAGTSTEATIVNHNINLVRKNTPVSEPSAPAPLSGPSHKVSGTVLDTQGQPIIGATVMVDGTQNGVVTDLDGNYTLTRVPERASVRFSCMGYVD